MRAPVAACEGRCVLDGVVSREVGSHDRYFVWGGAGQKREGSLEASDAASKDNDMLSRSHVHVGYLNNVSEVGLTESRHRGICVGRWFYMWDIGH